MNDKCPKCVSPEIEPWMENARQLAAQCWCDEETKSIEMDTRLAEACANRIAAWMATAAQAYNDARFYRDNLVRCGKAIGHESYIQDDGGVVNEVLVAKVPELVEKICLERADLTEMRRKLEEAQSLAMVLAAALRNVDRHKGLLAGEREALRLYDKAEKGGAS